MKSIFSVLLVLLITLDTTQGDDFRNTQPDGSSGYSFNYAADMVSPAPDKLATENSPTDSEGQDNERFRVTLFNPEKGEDKERLWSQTKLIFGLGLAMPTTLDLAGVIDWGPDEYSLSEWWDNVSSGPVWDNDHPAYNYLGHTYFGGVYYQVARKSGYDQWDSFIYTALMSTFYWEYGVEAFFEPPSIQDLIFTPVAGWLYGEWAFNKEREIRSRGGRVAGSQTLGDVALFLLDPVDTIASSLNSMFGKPLFRSGSVWVSRQPLRSNKGRSGQDDYIGINVVLNF